ncbi:MAG: imidazole glycerol phosphate synthase subunit HisH [Candidatus Paceibacterota bacterium]|jgi:glutamine amidotransferase
MSDTTRKPDVLVIDYGVGNHRSVTNALERLGYSYAVSHKKEDIQKARAYILPGVGAFEEAMLNLKKRDIIEVLRREVVEKKKPLLGICLGMQVLAEDSIEGGLHQGLGFIPGHVVRIPAASVRVPHVGWNELMVYRSEPLFASVPKGARFYFDHSFYFQTEKEYIAAACSYGEEITAAVQKDNIYGVQFHPEKSQTSGLRLLRAFMEHTKN